MIVVGVATWVLCCATLLFQRPPPPVRYVPGEIADHNLYSEVPFRYQDMAQTERLRERAAREVPPVYLLNQAAVQATLRSLEEVFAALRGPEADAGAPPRTADSSRLAELALQIGDEGMRSLERLAADTARCEVLGELVRDSLNGGIAETREIGNLEGLVAPHDHVSLLNDAGGTARMTLRRVSDLRDAAATAAVVAADFEAQSRPDAAEDPEPLMALLKQVLRPTMVYNTEATERARREALAGIKQVTRFVDANETLVLRGETITPDAINRLEKHQQELFSRMRGERGALGALQPAAICLLLLLAAAYVLHIVHPGLGTDRRAILLIASVIVLQMGLTRLVSHLYLLNYGSSFYLFPLLPLAFGAMLLAPLADLRVAVVTGVLCTGLAALQMRSPEAFHLCVSGVLSSLVGAGLMRHIRQRNHLFVAGLAVFGTILLLELVFRAHGNLPAGVLGRALLLLLLWAFVNALGTILLLSLLLPLFEFAFSLTTDMSLLELSDLNHPLLRRLQMEAPGTHHHSLMVATLAEQAAEAIGANALLTRVCAYFHDIGKLAGPEYFTENSAGGNTPHEGLQPRMSSLVILNHVRQGTQLARRYKLRKPLREAIEQHHGTSLIYFFYRRAKDEPGHAGEVNEGDYRYPGPRPRRKEIALISLADACEAAARSLQKPTAGRIRELVDRMFLERVREHELDDADLTFSELSTVRETMIRCLTSMLHARVAYPSRDDEHPLDKTDATTRLEEPGPAATGVVPGGAADAAG
ncbi:MAG: HDIG domain-containing protein [Lentisphaeria bacterium]|nr:HDIG domain-containing protein [Lentisphaeria bacterium]